MLVTGCNKYILYVTEMQFRTTATPESVAKRSKRKVCTYTKHMQLLRGSQHALGDYITPHVLDPTRGRLSAGTRASLPSLTTAANRNTSAEGRVELEEKERKDPGSSASSKMIAQTSCATSESGCVREERGAKTEARVLKGGKWAWRGRESLA